MESLDRVLSNFLGDSRDVEYEHRQQYLKVDKSQIVVVAVIAVIINLTMLKSDSLLFASAPHLQSWMFWCRGIYASITVLYILILLRTQDSTVFDLAAFSWSLVTAIYLLLLRFIRPLQDYLVPFDILYPVGVYLILPLRLRFSIALAVSFSLGAILASLLSSADISPTYFSVLVNSQIVAHILALPATVQVRAHRRRTFKEYLAQRDAREMANYLIHIDALTQSMTRHYFMDVAADEFLRARRYELPLSLLVLDLDHFKKINDNYGHPAGDQVLQRFAGVVLEQKRAQDIFGRLGGEEFGLLLPNTTLAKGRLVAQRIRQIWAETTTTVDVAEVRSTVSIGGAELVPDDPSFTALLHRADSMMYKAKHGGRNRVAFQE